MGFVVITGRSILWTFLSLVATLCMLTAVLSAKWIIGPHMMQGNARYQFEYVRPDYTRYRSSPGLIQGVGPFEYDNTPGMYPSIGIYNKCSVINGYNICSSFAAQGIFTNSSTFPTMWKISLVLYIIGLIILGVSLLGALLSFCNQTLFDRNIFSLSGSAQLIAGGLFVLAILSYASGFGATRMQSFCGPDAGFFSIGDCTFGWSFYLAWFGVILTFISAILSAASNKQAFSDRVTSKIDSGESFICIL
ncbi:LHFPL tetraspan subfamily member 2 protein isoform X2 [Diaphorina citri]|uniref:LHFPL tetraspan subfamily member 2 protein isoform X2 n=1 Tax=Diaphorina citri TaxID=121845 RepID=A0A3Q0J4T4_DIACI|nr:LHFPL tetraspan subfamily member 2 protein isoform X2 [Diaphorina citri]